MELWRHVWREGLVPQISTQALDSLRLGLVRDDHRLVQQATTCPPCLDVFAGDELEGACALVFGAWQGEGLARVGEVERLFAELCQSADERLGEPGVCRFFLSWFDETPRPVMRRELLAEVNRELNERLPHSRRMPIRRHNAA